jgi:hypothetical protein
MGHFSKRSKVRNRKKDRVDREAGFAAHIANAASKMGYSSAKLEYLYLACVIEIHRTGKPSVVAEDGEIAVFCLIDANGWITSDFGCRELGSVATSTIRVPFSEWIGPAMDRFIELHAELDGEFFGGSNDNAEVCHA